MELRYPLTRYVYRPLSVPIATLLARTRVTPTQVTFLSAFLAFLGGAAFALNAFIVGALFTALGSIADCIDGDLARLSGRTSAWGSYLDHVFDRWTDAALIVGLALSDVDRYGAVALFALVGTFMTSYTRTNSQTQGVDATVGFAGRDARMALLVVAALLHSVVPAAIFVALAATAAVGIVTAVQRMAWTRDALARDLEARP